MKSDIEKAYSLMQVKRAAIVERRYFKYLKSPVNMCHDVDVLYSSFLESLNQRIYAKYAADINSMLSQRSMLEDRMDLMVRHYGLFFQEDEQSYFPFSDNDKIQYHFDIKSCK